MEHALPDVSSASIAHREILAQALLDLPAKLVSEVVYVQNFSLVPINYSIQRCQSFQDLLYRYFRQIRYGCKSPNCDFSSCRSYQKRISKGPFRDFTNLSAWTLATFLATQDDPERGLCSNEPAVIPHGAGGYLESENNDKISISITEDRETPPQHGDVNENAGSPLKKDFKSFTQILFDTFSMKRLQITNAPEGFSEWRLGRSAAEAALSVDDRDDAVETDRRYSDDESRFEDSLQQELLSHEGDSKTADSESSKVVPCRTGLNTKSFMPGLWHTVDERYRATFNVLDLASVRYRSQFRTKSGRDYWKIDAGLTQYVSAHGAQGSRSESPKTLPGFPNVNHCYLVDDQFPTMPASVDARPTMPPRSLSRFTLEGILALIVRFELFKPKTPDEQNLLSNFAPPKSNLPIDSLIGGTATRREDGIAFLSQSIIFVLSSPDSLLKSFRGSDSESEEATNEQGFFCIVYAFTLLIEVDSLERYVFSSLLEGAKKLYPPKFDYSETSNIRTSLRSEPLESNIRFENSSSRKMALNDDEAMHIAKIGLAALVARISKIQGYGHAWDSFCAAHAHGRAICQDIPLILMDVFDDQLCIELMTVIVKALVVRKYISENTRQREPQLKGSENVQDSSENIINKLFNKIFYSGSSSWIGPSHETERQEMCRFHAEIILQWLRSVISRSWDGKVMTQRWGAVGCALEVMSYLFQMSDHLGINPSTFETPFMFTQLDIKQLPTQWLLPKRDRSSIHLLSFPFLFSREILVSYFRAINYAKMLKAYNGSMANKKLAETQDFRYDRNYASKFGKVVNRFFVLDLKRENILTDALNQLWRREGYELMKPLKVLIGGQEGEEGVDQGGVQQEFVRIAIGESIRPDYGLFATDEQTQMSWFQPFSLEPLYKFELLGLITSLAVYNGLTIPVTFPLALYRKLLHLPVTQLEHIRDGWPSLAGGLQDLLDWMGESVESVFALSYGFSVEAFGKMIHTDPDEIELNEDWPSNNPPGYVAHDADVQDDAASGFTSSKPGSRKSSASSRISSGRSDGSIVSDPSSDKSSFGPAHGGLRSPPNSVTSQKSSRMVTDKNRDSYVKDYIFWLTDKSIRPQYEAFARGFYTCIGPTSISLFNPEDLKSVVEGTQDIDVDELWQTATYDGGYFPTHRVIEDFWHVVRNLSPTQLRQLLEFVTASDRVPAKGLSNIQFEIQKNGDSDERLPTSVTCFGKLLLPEYSSRSILKERLCTAIEHCKGFGLS